MQTNERRAIECNNKEEENITNNINEIIKYVVDKAFNEGYQCGKDDAYAELNPSDESIKLIIDINDEIYRHAKDGSEDSNDEKLEEFDFDLDLAYGQMAGLTKRLYDALRKEGFSKSDAKHYVDTVIFAAMGAAQDHRDLR